MAVEAGKPSPAAPSRGPAARRGSSSDLRRLRLRLTLTFALVLLLLGLAGAESASLLQRALRIPTADDIAQRVCTAYQRQEYDVLVQVIDPAPLPPEVTGAFDAAAQADLRGQLKALDAQAGPVASCDYKTVASDQQLQGASRRQYFFSMTRGRGNADVFTAPMTLVRQPDGEWKISRGSNFLGGPTTQ